MVYKLVGANSDEKNIIDIVMQYIEHNFSDRYDLNKLKQIKVVNSLSGGSSARTIRDTIFIARKNGLELVQQNKIVLGSIQGMEMLFSTFYHELWHIDTWQKYLEMYEYIIRDKHEDLFLGIAYLYWIEYISHIDTVCMEIPDIMKNFCDNFVCKKWHKIEYGYLDFIKALPYYLVRSRYLKCFDNLTREIKSDELRIATLEFDEVSSKLFYNNDLEELEKAMVMRDMIERLLANKL